MMPSFASLPTSLLILLSDLISFPLTLLTHVTHVCLFLSRKRECGTGTSVGGGAEGEREP